jgi:hypothetical protein
MKLEERWEKKKKKMLQKTKNPTKLLLIFATGKLSHMYMQEVVYLFYNR